MAELEVLPPKTEPWQTPTERRHTPKMPSRERGYRDFRPCLRWEFGFSCAFCLTHETDFSEHEVEGWGVTGVEHYIPVSEAPEKENDYSNCYYACRFCNIARGSRPVHDGRQRLLDPCRDAWADHFVLHDDQILPRDTSPDAAYTHQAFDLDDERKVTMRRSRRETITECLAIVTRHDTLQSQLLLRLSQERDPLLSELSEELWEKFLWAWQDLVRFAPVPASADPVCSCGDSLHHTLPPALQSQTIRVFVETSVERTD